MGSRAWKEEEERGDMRASSILDGAAVVVCDEHLENERNGTGEVMEGRRKEEEEEEEASLRASSSSSTAHCAGVAVKGI